MDKTIDFRDVQIGDYFYITEDGDNYDFQKISETEAQRIDGAVADFSPEYAVGYYPPSVEGVEFPVYYDAQGHEHAEF
jgi:hypothetical protein